LVQITNEGCVTSAGSIIDPSQGKYSRATNAARRKQPKEKSDPPLNDMGSRSSLENEAFGPELERPDVIEGSIEMKRAVQEPKVGKGIIYLITNLINGKRYVGQSILTMAKRWSLHKSDAKRGSFSAISQAIRMHGAKNFSLELLVEADREQLNDLERKFILDLNTRAHDGRGYNLTPGGDNCQGCFSEETLRKISSIQKALWGSAEKRQLWSETMKALRAEHPDISQRQSETMKAHLAANPEIALKHSECMKALYAAEPQRAIKHSGAMKARWEDWEFRLDMSKKQKDSYRTHPRRASNHSDALKTCWMRPGFRIQMSKRHEARYASPEERRRTGEACQASSIVSNATGYRGVTKHGIGWRAQIKFCRKKYHLGTYSTPEKAALAYNQKAVELFGPGAFQNQIPVLLASEQYGQIQLTPTIGRMVQSHPVVSHRGRPPAAATRSVSIKSLLYTRPTSVVSSRAGRPRRL
jgi:group I intron endonuclease